jgi:hypothetical protein
MAFESLCKRVTEEGDGSKILQACALAGIKATDACSTLRGLQALQRVKGNGVQRETLLMDKLLPVALTNPSMKWEDHFSLAACLIRAAGSDPDPTPITVIRKPFRPVVPLTFPSTPVPPAAGIEDLARNPVASKRVCGDWEADVWFVSAAGRAFVSFWHDSHPQGMQCVDLGKEESLTAILFFGLQAATSRIEDMVERMDIAMNMSTQLPLSASEKQSSLSQVLRELRSENEDAGEALQFLSRALETFADGFQIIVELAWARAEDVRLASDDAVETTPSQNALAVASTARHEFIQRLRALTRVVKEWQQDNYTSMVFDSKLLACAKDALKHFELLNVCAGSVPSLASDQTWMQGWIAAFNTTLVQVQSPFRGTQVTSLLSDNHTASVSPLEMSASNWKEVEDALQTFPVTGGAGIAFRMHNHVLLPLNAAGRVEDKWVGGRVEKGETWQEAAWREFDEETFVRADMWVDSFSKTREGNKRFTQHGNNVGTWKSFSEMSVGTTQVAVSNGIRLERMKTSEVYAHKRMSTRDVWQQAFDSAPPEARAACLASLRIICESADGGRKSYTTLALDVEPLLPYGRTASIQIVPKRFRQHAQHMYSCASPDFADMFGQEPLVLDLQAMREWEQSGFEWVEETSIRTKRLSKCMQAIKASFK